jgi:biotin carboxyl carrier protein
VQANEHGKPFSSVTDTTSLLGPDDLRRLARVVEEYGLSELRYQSGNLRIVLRTAAASVPAAHPVAAAALPAAPADLFPPGDAGSVEPVFVPGDLPARAAIPEGVTGTPVEAPVMGVFYRAAAPGEPPLVEVGDTVEPGQPVGLIEAMKVFSEVLSETAGVVRAIPARNGALVQPGDVLLLIEAFGAAA